MKRCPVFIFIFMIGLYACHQPVAPATTADSTKATTAVGSTPKAAPDTDTSFVFNGMPDSSTIRFKDRSFRVAGGPYSLVLPMPGADTTGAFDFDKDGEPEYVMLQEPEMGTLEFLSVYKRSGDSLLQLPFVQPPHSEVFQGISVADYNIYIDGDGIITIRSGQHPGKGTQMLLDFDKYGWSAANKRFELLRSKSFPAPKEGEIPDFSF